MPDLDTTLHLDMLERSRRKRGLVRRLYRAIRRELGPGAIYGLEWGDPETVEPLRFLRNTWVRPYVKPEHTALEIGPGGGRWTRYLLGFGKLYVVDFHKELLAEVQRNFRQPNMEFVLNHGDDFPGVPPRSIDYLFSFGTFFHLDAPIIEAYLANMKPLLKPGANVVIQYSDKNKIMGRLNDGFSDNDPERMRAMVTKAGYTIVEEDLTTMWHSSLVRFTP